VADSLAESESQWMDSAPREHLMSMTVLMVASTQDDSAGPLLALFAKANHRAHMLERFKIAPIVSSSNKSLENTALISHSLKKMQKL
jgi:hypothetical protein